MSHRQTPGRRVVITGVGVISPIGIGRETFWTNLAAGKCGIGPVAHQFHGAAAVPGGFVGAEVADFDEKTARELVPKAQRKSIKVMCRDIQMGTASAMMAVADSGLDVTSVDHDRIGVDFGANLMYSPPTQLNDPCWNCLDDDQQFVMQRWAHDGLTKMEPLWLLKYLPNMPACHIAIFVDAHGPSNSVTQNEASGNLALTEALGVIQRGAADVMVAGATGARLHEFKVIHAALWGELGYRPSDPAASCRPFDVERTGEVAAEGACSYVLEEESHARARGATILGYLSGGGSSCVAGNRRLAAANAIRAALRSADLSPDDVGHVNAHGLGSPEIDLEEAQALHDVFGSRGGEIPVTSLKGAIGNSAAAAGTLELAGSLLALQQGVIPQTLHCDQPDPACDVNVVRGEPRSTNLRSVLNLNLTRFGQASAVVVQCDI
ncbi:MAG: beta-ketoacyl-[acyl-carrier-protein] synthase family protein [Planctomycetaceae bacterium]|nr:beta-ketoacyl-[acyl-carrier-protein] synthase family protein [Planctomycetaceae bacterium]